MKKYLRYPHFFLVFVFLINHFCSSAATRTWSGASTGTVAWAGNWGTDPVAGDDIEITTTGTLIITGMPALALNSITIHGGSNYTVEFQGANTLTVGGNAGTDFVIDASTGFKLSATNAPSITMAASATSTINGVFTINAGCTFTMSNASVVNTVSTTGSIVNAGTITGATTAKLIFEGASSYTHSQNGGTIPTADWNGATNTATSTCNVTGMTNTKPGGLITTSNTFYHLTWNCASQSANVLNSAAGAFTTSGQNMTCLGNFTITSCNGYTMAFSEDAAGALSTLTVGGNMVITNGDFYFNWWTTPVNANIAGDLNVNGGDVYGFHYTSGATTAINVTGSLNLSSGWFTVSDSDYSGVTLTVTNDINITGGEFNGTWSGAASPTIVVGDDIIVNGGAINGINAGTGSPAFTISGDLTITSNVFVGSESAGAPTFNITGNVSVSGTGWFYGSSGSGNTVFTIGGTLTIGAGGSYYGTDDSGNATFNITTDLVSSGGWGTGSRSTGVATYNITRDLIVSGGTFYGAYSSAANAVLNITRNLDVSSGWFVGSYGVGAPVITVTGSVNQTGGNIYLSYSTGATVMNVTTDVNISSGWFAMTYATSSPDLNITRDLNVSGGTFSATESGGACTPTIDITRDLNQTGGTLYGAYYTGTPTFNVGGNLNHSAGTFYGTDDAGSPTFNVTGNVAISGTASFRGTSTSSTGDPIFNITGNLTASGGSTFFYGSRSSGANTTFNIQGSVDISTGTSVACSGYTSNTPTCTFNLTGAASNNLTLPTGLTYNTSAAWSWNVSAGRTITLLSNVEIGGTASACIFTNNGTLIMGTYTFPAITTAAASFVNASGATLKTAHLSGLSTTAATGAIQVTGTKTFSSAASYVFNGAAAQVTGNFGASTTPTASTVANLEFNNTSGVTLTAGLIVADAGTLTLTTGYHNLATYTLQLGTSAANTLAHTAGGLYSSTDNGSFKRWIPTGAVTSTSGNYYGLFPFKKSASKLNVFELNSTANVTTAGFATTVTDVVDFPDDNGTVQAIKSGKGITLTLTTIAGGTFGIKVTSGNYIGGTLSDYTLVTYTGGSTGYQTTFAATTGTTTNPIVARTDVSMANLAQTWVVGTYNFGATTLPIELVSFTGTKAGDNNILFWTTETELSNDFFTVEKTTDGEIYEIVGTTDGAGNSNQLLEYNLTDNDVRQVLNYYRLKQTDFDGKFTYSNTITIDNRSGISKEVNMITNILGQEVNEYYRGVVIIVYTDGTSIKVIQ